MKSRPWFCGCKDPETGKKCNKLLDALDDGFIENYGFCKCCFVKYNCHIDQIEQRIEELKNVEEKIVEDT